MSVLLLVLLVWGRQLGGGCVCGLNVSASITLSKKEHIFISFSISST